MRFNKNEAWSFGKSARSTSKSNKNPGPAEYEGKYTGKRSPKWNMGEKLYFKNKEEIPGAGKYDILPKIFNGPKYSIAKYEPKDKINDKPGPSNYSPNKILRDYPKYTMAKKYDTLWKNDNPGPGEYNGDKKIHIHSHKFGNEDRGKTPVNTSPGPIYLPNKVNLKKTPAFSIGIKPNEKEGDPGPGPGNYSPKVRHKSPNYIFGKEKRERILKNETPGTGAYDSNLNDLKKSPAFKIGKEKRDKDFDNNNPGPGAHDAKYFFKKSPGYSLGREKKKFVPNNIPGPGAYDTSLKNRGGITMKRKYYFKDKDPTPGPDSYNYNSNAVLKHSPAYSLPHSKRIKDIKSPYPGNFDYNLGDVSKKAPRTRFGREKRDGAKLNEYPGPADYHIPCSIRDVPEFVRKKGKFEPQYTFI